MSQYGYRISVMLGGVISAIGLGLGMFVTELFHVYLTFGVLTGMFCIAINIKFMCLLFSLNVSSTSFILFHII
jgi:hypothetical protein